MVSLLFSHFFSLFNGFLSEKTITHDSNIENNNFKLKVKLLLFSSLESWVLFSLRKERWWKGHTSLRSRLLTEFKYELVLTLNSCLIVGVNTCVWGRGTCFHFPTAILCLNLCSLFFKFKQEWAVEVSTSHTLSLLTPLHSLPPHRSITKTERRMDSRTDSQSMVMV